MPEHVDIPVAPASVLPAAVPEYVPDLTQAHAALGQALAYNAQLRQVLRERAAEANRLHDNLSAALARIAELERQVG